MAFKTSKFNIASYAGSGCDNSKEYSTLLLTGLKESIIDAGNGSWELEDDIEPMVEGYTGTSGIHTMQLTNGTKYLRIWHFSGNISATFIDLPDINTTTSLTLYTGNLFKQNYSDYNSYYAFGDSSGFYFAVSDDYIDKDFAKDLGLSIPMFGINNEPIQGSCWVGYDGGKISSYGAVATTITDGSMIGFIFYIDGYCSVVAYAPDMFINANQSDNNTEGVISMNTSSNTNFTFGDNSDSYNTSKALFTTSSGGFDFDGLIQGCECGKNKLATSQSSTKMVTGPVCYYMYPYTFSGSDEDGVVNGIGLKGWVNTDYFRTANVNVLTNGQRGTSFANGKWFCPSQGTLICWDGSNVSPFDPAE